MCVITKKEANVGKHCKMFTLSFSKRVWQTDVVANKLATLDIWK